MLEIKEQLMELLGQFKPDSTEEDRRLYSYAILSIVVSEQIREFNLLRERVEAVRGN